MPCRFQLSLSPLEVAVALEALQLLVDALARGAEQLGNVFLRQLQADADHIFFRQRSREQADVERLAAD